MKAKVSCTRPKYVCGNEHMKLVGTTDGLFPDFGHHLEGKMGGLWLYPVKVLDGFWMRVKDVEAQTVDCFLAAIRSIFQSAQAAERAIRSVLSSPHGQICARIGWQRRLACSTESMTRHSMWKKNMHLQ